eukprot:748990-Hanusia_phi.AAC.1
MQNSEVLAILSASAHSSCRLTGSIDQNSCESYCPKGFYSKDGKKSTTSICYPCQEGNFSSLSGSSFCSLCSLVRYFLTRPPPVTSSSLFLL